MYTYKSKYDADSSFDFEEKLRSQAGNRTADSLPSAKGTATETNVDAADSDSSEEIPLMTTSDNESTPLHLLRLLLHCHPGLLLNFGAGLPTWRLLQKG